MNARALTDREKECLRLLLHPMKAKDIARVTGLSIHTVNEHLKSARRKLETTDSLTAAKILRAREGTPKISDTTESGSPPDFDSGQAGPAETLAESVGLGRGSLFLPFAGNGRPWNDLRLQWRIAWPLLLLGVIALGAGAIVAGASELSQLVIALSR
ncbi:MAG: helix-turn-helix transcriptional regulator [Candidatus Sphingomonas phytovorans]|nr:helix-turn-helix transcriptional regulator [Sphingomonas sp.]WEK02551.1 MAG: helix-turn-helix transcriptional regulator [Sphingomonas sp.]